MVFNNIRTSRWCPIALLIILFVPALILPPSAKTEKQSMARFAGASFHDGDESRKEGLSRQEKAREAVIYHQANLQRLERTHPLGAEALKTDIINQDINDISVIQGDERVIAPPNKCDLSGRTVSFTPSGAGYTISTTNGTFDTNFGTKLDFTGPSATNPKRGADPGDDAAISQPLGFSVSFFGTSYSSIAISTNGNLTFRPLNV